MENVNVKEEKEEETSRVSQEPQQFVVPSFDDWIKEKPRYNYIKLKVNESQTLSFKKGKPDEMISTDFGGNLDVSYLRKQAKERIRTHLEDRLPLAFETCLQR